MRIIHGSGYNDEDRKQFVTLIYRNIYTSIQALVNAMNQLRIPFEDPQCQHHAERLKSVVADTVSDITEEDKLAIKTLWTDPGIQICYENRREFQLSDSTK